MNVARYLDRFVAESREHLSELRALLSGLDDRAGVATARRELCRHLHSVKGMAATMGQASVVRAAHRAESWLDAEGERIDAAARQALEEALAGIERELTRISARPRPSTGPRVTPLTTPQPDVAAQVPIDAYIDRLRLVLRDAAARCGRQVDLIVDGSDVPLPRRLLEGLLEPLEHVLRNAVAHGIEESALRVRTGKAPKGTVRVRVRRESREARIEIEDDGRGLDAEQLRLAAVRSGEVSPEKAAKMSRAASIELAVVPGLSTRATADETSGRGVGLEIASRAARALGGRFSLRDAAGGGACVVFRLPIESVNADRPDGPGRESSPSSRLGPGSTPDASGESGESVPSEPRRRADPRPARPERR